MRGDVDRHDREAGRQLAVLVALVTLGLGAVAVFGGASLGLGAAIAASAVATIGAFVFPIAAIRFLSGRWSELVPDADPTTKDALERMEEGLPLEVWAAEKSLPTDKRKRLGIVLMIAGLPAGLVGAAFAALVLGSLPNGAFELFVGAGGSVAFAGLVLWYRTL
jgi:hypothetical protein